MITFLEEIKSKINENANLELVSLIDNSKLHGKHSSFDPNKFHLKLIVKSEKLRKMSKIEAHKFIYSILKDEMKNKIHALEIVIK
tara:strand:+ start:76 stop:330 length:255 start_codon:yes stop_codon:yes gene_type:complete